MTEAGGGGGKRMSHSDGQPGPRRGGDICDESERVSRSSWGSWRRRLGQWTREAGGWVAESANRRLFCHLPRGTRDERSADGLARKLRPCDSHGSALLHWPGLCLSKQVSWKDCGALKIRGTSAEAGGELGI